YTSAHGREAEPGAGGAARTRGRVGARALAARDRDGRLPRARQDARGILRGRRARVAVVVVRGAALARLGGGPRPRRRRRAVHRGRDRSALAARLDLRKDRAPSTGRKEGLVRLSSAAALAALGAALVACDGPAIPPVTRATDPTT